MREPPHEAIAATPGVGKSDAIRKELPIFIKRQKKENHIPHRVLFHVPHHRVSDEAVHAMAALGINAAVMRGREAKAHGTNETRCLNLAEAYEARMVGAEVEKAVCGSGKEGKPSCPFRNQCRYQAQKAAVREADVVIGKLPAAMGGDFGAIIIDEAFWQAGLNRAANQADQSYQRSAGSPSAPLRAETQELFHIADNLMQGLADMPVEGGHVTRYRRIRHYPSAMRHSLQARPSFLLWKRATP
jgi:hypothetical protein